MREVNIYQIIKLKKDNNRVLKTQNDSWFQDSMKLCHMIFIIIDIILHNVYCEKIFITRPLQMPVEDVQ